jgi:hypothetical protein
MEHDTGGKNEKKMKQMQVLFQILYSSIRKGISCHVAFWQVFRSVCQWCCDANAAVRGRKRRRHLAHQVGLLNGIF